MIETLIALFLPVTVATALVLFVGRARPNWSYRRMLMTSALPIPALVAAVAIYVILSAATSTAERCGVDACGMATIAAIFVFGYAISAFLLGVIAAAAVLRDWRL